MASGDADKYLRLPKSEPTISPTASLMFGAGILLTLGGVVALIVAAVFAVVDRKS